MYTIHTTYRELQENTNEGLNKVKLKKEIIDKQSERDWFKSECNKIDIKCHERQEELYKQKDKHNENLQSGRCKLSDNKVCKQVQNCLSSGMR